MIRTILVVIFITLFVLVFGPTLILYSVVSGSIDPLYRVGLAGVRLMLRIAGVRVRAEGVENIPEAACIFVANHTSAVDPPAAVVAIPRRVAFVAKKEVFRVPIVATVLRLVGIVSVDRAVREAAAASMDQAVERLKEGLSFVIFAEGTRSADGRLRPFKKGTFVVAIQAGAPVVPVSIVGAHKRMRKGEWAVHPGEVILKFGPPIDPTAYKVERRAELMLRVHAAVAAGLPENQQPEPLERPRGALS